MNAAADVADNKDNRNKWQQSSDGDDNAFIANEKTHQRLIKTIFSARYVLKLFESNMQCQ